MARILDFADGFESSSAPIVTDSTIDGDLDVSGNVTIEGNLTVQGTTTTLNTATLDVEDLNITINKNGNDASAEGSGLTVDRTSTDGSLVFDSTKASKWKAGLVGSELEIVDVSSTQTLSNKTLVSPAGITKSDVGLSNVDNTSDATKNSATATLTNKTLTSPTINTPSVDIITLDGQASTPSNPASGFYKAYVKDSTSKLTILNSSGVETTVGSGGTGQNFITNGDAEAGTTGWAVYADAAGTSPIDGTGGSANVTITDSSTDPLSGNKSFVLTKDAVNRQGQGFSYDFSIDNAAKSKILTVKFDYICGSGFTAGTSSTNSDITVWIYDVTNSRLIQPSSFKLLSNSITVADQFQAEFQSFSDSTSYRLIFHVGTTSATAWSVKVDNIVVSPSEYVFGTPVSDWTAYTPTLSAAFGTTSNVSFFYRRVGDDLEIKGTFTAGTRAASIATFSLPTGLALNTSKISISNTSANPGPIVGFYRSNEAAANVGGALVTATGTSTSLIYLGIADTLASSHITPGNGDQVIASSVIVSLEAKVPIAGFSSSVQMADQTSTRIVAARAQGNTGQAINTTPAVVIFNTVTFDTHGSYNSATGTYTCAVPGIYRVSSGFATAGVTLITTANVDIILRRNGTEVSRTRIIGSGGATQNYYPRLTDSVSLNSGDTVTIQAVISTATTIENSSSTFFAIERISGPSQIAASEKVLFSGYVPSDQALTANVTDLSLTAIKDTHAAWDGNEYVCPISGDYQVSSVMYLTTGVSTMRIYVDGNSSYLLQGLSNQISSGCFVVPNLRAGQRISVRMSASLSIAGSATISNASLLSIARVPGSN